MLLVPALAANGRWAQIQRELVENLSIDQFRSRYATQGLPVILKTNKPALTREWTIADLQSHAGSGDLSVHYPSDRSTEWGGFYKTSQLELREYLAMILNGTAAMTGAYGFDYDTKCSAPKLLDNFQLLDYFQDDVLPFGVLQASWPSLILGPEGSRSAMHCDNSFLPFWLTVLKGKKMFRVIRLPDWRANLSAVVTGEDCSMITPINGFDDAAVEREYIARGATVYTAHLNAGDSLYVPVGALHGGYNLPGAGVTMALTSNYLDIDHTPQVLRDYCPNFGEDRLCRHQMPALLHKTRSLRTQSLSTAPAISPVEIQARKGVGAVAAGSVGPQPRSQPYTSWLLGTRHGSEGGRWPFGEETRGRRWCLRGAGGHPQCRAMLPRCVTATGAASVDALQLMRKDMQLVELPNQVRDTRRERRARRQLRGALQTQQRHQQQGILDAAGWK